MADRDVRRLEERLSRLEDKMDRLCEAMGVAEEEPRDSYAAEPVRASL